MILFSFLYDDAWFEVLEIDTSSNGSTSSLVKGFRVCIHFYDFETTNEEVWGKFAVLLL